MNKAVFLDRDGTINYDYGYVHEIKKFKFLPNAVDALEELSKSRYKIIVTTNQSGIGRGYFTEQDFLKLSRHMVGCLQEKNARIDAVYYCPHSPEENCACRKPKIAMILAAKKDFGIALDKSFVIGDKSEDIAFGRNAGCRTILITKKRGFSDADLQAGDLRGAVNFILDGKI